MATYNVLYDYLWLASSVAVETAIAVMHLTKTLHPPCHILNYSHWKSEDS
ncbi:MAG: HPP family protein [Thermodesulfobacteriota bacterium]|nr:HPP family protein [Thermodesulfobacteriota bacterium]